MTLQELRYFCVTAEVLHYTRAANLLYISQPSLSYALNKLEKELGVPLFEKQGKKVSLTKYGKEFLPYAKRALNELSSGIEHLQEIQRPTAGIISLGYIYSVSFALLPSFVNRFYAYQGSDQTAFRFHQGTAGELIEQLLGGSLDLLIAGRTDISSIDCLPLGDLASTVATIIMGSPDKPEFALNCSSPAGEMHFSTEEIRPVLEGVSLAEPDVVQWIQQSLQEEIE